MYSMLGQAWSSSSDQVATGRTLPGISLLYGGLRCHSQCKTAGKATGVCWQQTNCHRHTSSREKSCGTHHASLWQLQRHTFQTTSAPGSADWASDLHTGPWDRHMQPCQDDTDVPLVPLPWRRELYNCTKTLLHQDLEKADSQKHILVPRLMYRWFAKLKQWSQKKRPGQLKFFQLKVRIEAGMVWWLRGVGSATRRWRRNFFSCALGTGGAVLCGILASFLWW